MKLSSVGLGIAVFAAAAGAASAASDADVRAVARTLVEKGEAAGRFGAANVGGSTAAAVRAQVRCVSRYRSGRCPSIFPYSATLGDIAPGRGAETAVPGWRDLVWKRGEYKITVEVSTASRESRFGRLNDTASVEFYCRDDGKTSTACFGR